MGEFDNTMKMLVDADPKAFATFILSQARRSGKPHLAAATIRSVERRNGASRVRPDRTSLDDGRRWLDELMTDCTANAESIAARDGCSV